MTFTEFLAWEEQQAERHEFFGGETFAIVGGTARHNRVILNLASRIGDHLDGTTCQVFAGSMKVQFDDGVLYPDLMVTCGKAEAGDEQAVTDPKLIVEVLSPGTRGYDQRDKFVLYRTLASLREYVLIDQAKCRVEVFSLSRGGAWLLTDQTTAGVLSLASIGCTLSMELVVAAAHAAYMLLAVSRTAVWDASRAYARELILSCEYFLAQSPAKKKAAGKSASKTANTNLPGSP